MTLVADAITAITRAPPAPVLFVDTCSLLDIVRAPRRNKPHEVRAARLFLTCLRKPVKTLHLLVGTPTPAEWNDHIDTAEDDCRAAVEGYNTVAAICGHLALPAAPYLPAGVAGLPGILRQLSADLLAAAVTMDNDLTALGRAVDRMIHFRLPVKRSGKGGKDAVIVEHAIETTTQLRNAVFGEPCVFTSSNTEDFAATVSTTLHPTLAPAFQPINLLYASSLTHAEVTLRNLLGAVGVSLLRVSYLFVD